MPSDPREPPQNGPELTNLLELLCSSEVDFILVGGLAAVSQGAPIATFDIDIVPATKESNLGKLLDFLLDINARHRDRPGGQVLRPTIEDLTAGGHCLLMTDHGPLDILGTIDSPSGGGVFYDGENVFSLGDRALARFRNRTVGFVFQFHHLLPEFTAVENTMMPALIQGMTKDKARRRAEELMEQVGLSDRTTHKPGELSGGEQQRVAVARALIMEPDVLLADEPTGNLDRETGEGVFQTLLQMNEQKHITTVVVTHNEDIASRLSRHVRLVDGKVLS